MPRRCWSVTRAALPMRRGRSTRCRWPRPTGASERPRSRTSTSSTTTSTSPDTDRPGGTGRAVAAARTSPVPKVPEMFGQRVSLLWHRRDHGLGLAAGCRPWASRPAQVGFDQRYDLAFDVVRQQGISERRQVTIVGVYLLGYSGIDRRQVDEVGADVSRDLDLLRVYVWYRLAHERLVVGQVRSHVEVKELPLRLRHRLVVSL